MEIALVYFFSGILGLCVGSFLNVVIYRLPEHMSLAFPASHCTQCGYRLRWYDNIPVLSYLILRGKCRKCKNHISFRYTVVEIANTVLWITSVFLFWEYSPVYACTVMLACSVLLCIAFIDLEHMLIFDRFWIALAVLAIPAMFTAKDGYPWWHHMIGCAAGLTVFLCVYFGISKVVKQEALGFGDVKLAAAAGLFLAWQKFLLAMLIASITASVLLVLFRVIRKDEKGKEYPFAPFIVAGCLIAIFFGDTIIHWYLVLLI